MQSLQARVLVAFVGLALFSGVQGVSSVDAQRLTIKLDARMTGDQEVPPADPDGEGRAQVVLKPAEGQICFDIRFKDAGTPNRGHIHQGGPGVNGPIVVPFFELATTPTDPRHDQLESKRDLEDCVTVAADLIAAIAATPGAFYVNLHNARFPGGMMRGQLEE